MAARFFTLTLPAISIPALLSAPCWCEEEKHTCKLAPGIVADSDPQKEFAECMNKAKALNQGGGDGERSE